MQKTVARQVSQASLDALKDLPPGRQFERALWKVAIELGFWRGAWPYTGGGQISKWEQASEETLNWLDANHVGWRGKVIYSFETGVVVG